LPFLPTLLIYVNYFLEVQLDFYLMVKLTLYITNITYFSNFVFTLDKIYKIYIVCFFNNLCLSNILTSIL